MPADPYAALNLAKTASAAAIKQAYRKLARAHHPDLHPDDKASEARFKEISAAYDLLKDPAKRARFDAGEIDASGAETPPRQYYRDFAEAQGGAYRPQQGFRSPFGGAGDPADIFAEILRQRGGAQGGGFMSAGEDLRFALNVPFLIAARGGEMRLSLGAGEAVAVTIPQGAQEGQTLRLRGKGGAGSGFAARGDALITLSLLPHPVFRREGSTIRITLPITLDEAILGAKVSAPTLAGAVSLTIPPQTSSGRILRLRGRGIKGAGQAQGDQLVEVQIVLPAQIDAPLAAFFAQWRQTDDPRAQMRVEAER